MKLVPAFYAVIAFVVLMLQAWVIFHASGSQIGTLNASIFWLVAIIIGDMGALFIYLETKR